MFRPHAHPAAEARRGIILLVVVALLTLFAIVGLSFVLYAEAEARAAQTARETEQPVRPDGDPELLFSYFLGQLLYDVPDDTTGVYSAMRGHSLARSMYGCTYDLQGSQILPADNVVPFNGTGRLKTGTRPFPMTGTALFNRDDYDLINYTYFVADGFLRDPERTGKSTEPSYRTDLNQRRRDFAGGFNVPYTYPDLNNMFLGAVSSVQLGNSVPQQNVVRIQSFHRPWLFGPLTKDAAGNQNWKLDHPEGKYLTLRPRTVDMDPSFPYPEDLGGDVKNLVGSPGYYLSDGSDQLVNNDSIWMDLGHPVMTSPDGRRFKPLFAPLIIDLDSLINLNVVGNTRGRDPNNPQLRFHASNQGWGPWEINPSRILDYPPGGMAQEWTRLFTTGLVGPQAPYVARYGPPGDEKPGSPGTQADPPDKFHSPPRFYGQFDYDACKEQYQLSGQFKPDPAIPPPQAPTGPYSCFPPLNQTGYTSGNDTGMPPDELTDHPRLWNIFQPKGGDRLFDLSNLEALLRYADTNSPGLTSDLFRLCPENLKDPRRRRLLTTYSFDVNRPGMSPWLTTTPAASPPALVQDTGNPLVYWPQAGSVGFPQLGSSPGGEFLDDWRAASTTNKAGMPPVTGLNRLFDRLDLNRPLPNYPTLSSPDAEITDTPGFRAAEKARQMFAADIFNRLRAITGTAPPFGATNPGEKDVLRWLAQLAVNIVDYIDNDDYMTPFNWNEPGIDNPPTFNPTGTAASPPEWVFGTELPRVVLNEAYVARRPPQAMGAPTDYFAWVELYNPFYDSTDPAITNVFNKDNGEALLQMQSYAAYQVLLCKPDAGKTPKDEIRRKDNVTGTPDLPFQCEQMPGGSKAGVTSFPTGGMPSKAKILPSKGAAAAAIPNGPDNTGYYVLGPETGSPIVTGITPILMDRGMHFQVADGAEQIDQTTFVLQRLACPNRRPQLDRTLPDYNPYVTVDFMADVSVTPTDLTTGDLAGATTGRDQPYSDGARKAQMSGTTPLPKPDHTFYQVNKPVASPFTWLVHLDRQLRTPMELLNVSAFKPSELTQQFGPGFKHRVPWFDETIPSGTAASLRLYRLFEFLETRSQAAGLGVQTISGDPKDDQFRFPDSITAGTGKEVRLPQKPGEKALLTHGIRPSGAPWNVQIGTVLVIVRLTPDGKGDFTNQDISETVRVTAVTATSFTADFVKDHPSNNSESYEIWLTSVSDRVPGKINLNTVWDLETFQALCDKAVANNFTDDDVNNMFEALAGQAGPTGQVTMGREGWRTPRIQGPNMTYLPRGTPGPTDRDDVTVGSITYKLNRPFRGLAPGFTATGDTQYTKGIGVNDTIFAAQPGSTATPPPRMFEVGTNLHPYQKYEVMAKIFNHLTSRSNTFAVWLTVGFFEVKDESTQPVKLGAEIGRAENRHVRHRMFAIIDRTNLLQQQAGNPDPSTLATVLGQLAPALPSSPVFTLQERVSAGSSPLVRIDGSRAGTTIVSTNLGSPPAPPVNWPPQSPTPPLTWHLNYDLTQLQTDSNGKVVRGPALMIDGGTSSEEVVLVTQAPPALPDRIQATFAKDHLVGASVRVLYTPGNPGPQPRFDYRNNTAIVPYLSIIK